MSSSAPSQPSNDPHDQSMHSWRANAEFWDANIGEGNQYWTFLQVPALERMIPVNSDPGKKIRALDLAGGNGIVSRWLATTGRVDSVLVTDGSEEMMKYAKKRAEDMGCGKQFGFKRVDVTDEKVLEGLLDVKVEGQPDDERGFDIITMNMALMDVSTILPLATVLPKLLKPKSGIFVATLLHPVFWTSGASRLIEIIDKDEHQSSIVVRSRKISEYLHVKPWRGVAMHGQPEQQFYFHRPIHELFGTFFGTGLVMDRIEEPAFGEEHRKDKVFESHQNITQLPAVLAFRMRTLN